MKQPPDSEYKPGGVVKGPLMVMSGDDPNRKEYIIPPEILDRLIPLHNPNRAASQLMQMKMKPVPDSGGKERRIAMVGDDGQPELIVFNIDFDELDKLPKAEWGKARMVNPPIPPKDRHDRDVSKNIPLTIFTWSSVILFIVIEIWAIIKFLL